MSLRSEVGVIPMSLRNEVEDILTEFYPNPDDFNEPNIGSLNMAMEIYRLRTRIDGLTSNYGESMGS